MPLAFNQGCKGLVPCQPIDERFFYYQLLARRPELHALGQGSTFRELSGGVLAAVRVFHPPLEDQRRIADRIKGETDRVDGVLMRKRQLLGLLRQKRLGVVHAAVAGQLTPTCRPRRRASVPWLPSVPEHWRIAKLTLVAKLGTGHTPSRSEPSFWEQERTIPWITTSDIDQVRDDRCEVITQTRQALNKSGLENSAAVLHPAGTVVLSRTASVGFSAIMGHDMATSQDFATWTCSDALEPRFLLMCLRAMRPDLIGRLAMGSTHKTIYMADIQALRIPLPAIDEQREAVRAATRETVKLDSISALIEAQLPLLEERRQALITEAVTGPIRSSSGCQPAVVV